MNFRMVDVAYLAWLAGRAGEAHPSPGLPAVAHLPPDVVGATKL